MLDALAPHNLARDGLLDAAALSALLARYYGGDRTLASRIWNLVSFQMWWQRTY